MLSFTDLTPFIMFLFAVIGDQVEIDFFYFGLICSYDEIFESASKREGRRGLSIYNISLRFVFVTKLEL
jgi:hypothetical protein